MTSDVQLGAIDLVATAAGLEERWSPRVAGAVNDVMIRVAKVEGEFVWHDHPDSDEAFQVLSGHLDLDVRDDSGERTIPLGPGDFFVVPRGIGHRPRAEPGTTIVLIDAAGTVNTGTAGGPLTAPVDAPLS